MQNWSRPAPAPVKVMKLPSATVVAAVPGTRLVILLQQFRENAVVGCWDLADTDPRMVVNISLPRGARCASYSPNAFTRKDNQGEYTVPLFSSTLTTLLDGRLTGVTRCNDRCYP
jgi:hypothetical protein